MQFMYMVEVRCQHLNKQSHIGCVCLEMPSSSQTMETITVVALYCRYYSNQLPSLNSLHRMCLPKRSSCSSLTDLLETVPSVPEVVVNEAVN